MPLCCPHCAPGSLAFCTWQSLLSSVNVEISLCTFQCLRSLEMFYFKALGWIFVKRFEGYINAISSLVAHLLSGRTLGFLACFSLYREHTIFSLWSIVQDLGKPLHNSHLPNQMTSRNRVFNFPLPQPSIQYRDLSTKQL